MAGISTSYLTQTKKDQLNGLAHALCATVALSGASLTSAKTVTGLSSTAGLYRGMNAAGANVAAGAIVKTVDSTTQVTLSDVGTSSATATVTFSGDIYWCALIKSGMAGTYGAASTKYSDVTGNTDEATGAGYTAGGFNLSASSGNLGASVSSTTAMTQFNANPSWTGATLSVAGCMVYNASVVQNIANAAVGVFDFGGTQAVGPGGTLTLLQPVLDATHALLRIQ